MQAMHCVKRGPRVHREAEALAAAHHPGVVELVDFDGDVLSTGRVDGCALADAGPLAVEEVAGVVAAVAATVADLHDRGVVHGGLDATHVLLRDDGRPVLCSLGRGGEPQDDVAALGLLLGELLAAASRAPSAKPRAAHRRRRRRPPALASALAPPPEAVLTSLAGDALLEPAARPSARALATAIRDRVPGARLPAGASAPPQLLARPGPRRRPVVAVAVAVAFAGASAVAIATLVPVDRRPSAGGGRSGVDPGGRAVASTTTAVPPEPERVWPAEPVGWQDGVATYRGARYAVGEPGDEVALGDWTCTGERTLAVLRVRTGELFAFDRWAAPGEDLPARFVGEAAGATRIRAVDADADGCDELEATGGSTPPMLLALHR